MLSYQLALGLATLSLALAGCGGGAYQASGGARFELDAAREINDDDVKKAFDATPQLGEKSRVAYFTFDDKKADDVEHMLASLPAVSSTYRIPALFVTGKRRFDEPNPWQAPEEVSVKKLRLLAARAHADVLVVLDYGYQGSGPNPLVALNLLIVPALFVPFMSNETQSYAQAFVIDVRNGYLYGEAKAEQKSGNQYVTIYGRSTEDMFDLAWPELLTKVRAEVGKTLATGSSLGANPLATPSANPLATPSAQPLPSPSAQRHG